MSKTVCKDCGKKMTAKVKTCPYCNGATQTNSSILNKCIIVFALLAIAGVANVLIDTKSDADPETKPTEVASETKESQATDSSKGVSLAQVVGGMLKSKPMPNFSDDSTQLNQTEDINQIETVEETTYDDSAEDFSEVSETDTFEDTTDADAFEQDAVAESFDETEVVEEDSEKIARKKYWQDYYRKKFTLPNAGTKVSVQLKNGSLKSGEFLGVVNQYVKLLVDEKLENVSKSKLSKRSQLRYFYSDYVNYFTNKKLTAEGLN